MLQTLLCYKGREKNYGLDSYTDDTFFTYSDTVDVPYGRYR